MLQRRGGGRGRDDERTKSMAIQVFDLDDLIDGWRLFLSSEIAA